MLNKLYKYVTPNMVIVITVPVITWVVSEYPISFLAWQVTVVSFVDSKRIDTKIDRKKDRKTDRNIDIKIDSKIKIKINKDINKDRFKNR